MFEIKFWGRGGQGAVIASIILGKAAVLIGKYALSAPKFGAERGGAPVTADFRVADDKISARYPIAKPDCVVVLDEGLITPEIIHGLKDNGWLIINSAKPPEDFFYLGPFKVATVDAKSVAAKYGIGTRELPITNTTILGAAAKTLEDALGITIDILCQAIAKSGDVPPHKIDDNIAAAKEAFEKTVIKISTNSIRPNLSVPTASEEVDKQLLELSKIISISLRDTAGNKTGLWRTIKPIIDYAKCKNRGLKCGICRKFCPEPAILVEENGKVAIDYDHCKGCGICSEECPLKAIEMRPEAEEEQQ
jgi:2-oxoacid:acceptor oxidoreductase gamma subunit (pyruvate/2-ketoisovalerate family)/2-oxoacid:acceptor oxidoreductase delta subunit (pyruvate/2-ketoisovalerate family)